MTRYTHFEDDSFPKGNIPKNRKPLPKEVEDKLIADMVEQINQHKMGKPVDPYDNVYRIKKIREECGYPLSKEEEDGLMNLASEWNEYVKNRDIETNRQIG